MTTATTNIDVTETRQTDLPEFAKSIPPIEPDFDELIEDGLAMHIEIIRYRSQPVVAFTELDTFFDSIK